jgi:hypothetical protein
LPAAPRAGAAACDRRELAEDSRLKPCEKNRCFRAAIGLAAFGLAVMTASCERYVNVAPARYPDIGTVSTEKWRVETENRVYRVHWITATDSTLTIHQFISTETKTTPTYPMSPKRMANPAQPLTLRHDEVVKLERIDVDHGKATVAGLALTALLIGVFFTLLGMD